ncbi:MAG: FAD binding domain-containing protein [Thermoplasmata archaeon]|nr:FAD binding domain-containing protein [Thermoplasmata archaeon]
MNSFELVVPETAEEAVAALQALAPGEAAPIAGGTDLLIDVDEGRVAPRRVISLRRLPWKTLDWNAGALTVGSTLPLRSLEEDPQVRVSYPGLYQAVRAVGSVALRHRATLGGNLVRSAPASDLVPVLLSLDAEVDLVGPSGDRRVPVDRFVQASRRTDLRPGELVRSVYLPEARPSAFLWQRVRPSNDISQVAVAVAFSPAQRRWKVAVGGVTPRPTLLPEASDVLGSGRPTSSEVRRASEIAASRAAFVTDRRASEEYRRHLVATLLERAVGSAVNGGRFPA